MDTSYVKIFDTTLRDGEQAPGNSMNVREKVRMAKQLERLGVDVIEAGFPIASPDDFKAVKAIASACEKVEVCGLSRALEKDIHATWDAIKEAKKPRIHTFIATSPIHMEHKLRIKPEEVLQMAVDAVKLAKSLCDRVDFSPEDGTRTEPAFLYKVLEAVINAGADTINIPDTVGYSTPQEFYDLITGIKENVPNIEGIIISTHCHDDLGLAVANSLAGVHAGARQVECTINGIGERSGNSSLEEVVMGLRIRKDFYNVETGINTKELYPTSRLLTSITGVPVQPNKAIVGANAFSHEAGIHQHAILRYRETYEIMDGKDVGRETATLVLGKHSGRAALADRLQTLGYELASEELNEVYDRFVRLADKKKEIYDEDLILIAEQKEDKEHYRFCDLYVRVSTKDTPLAEVTLILPDGSTQTETARGDGPINATYSAIDKIVNLDNTLLEYTVHAVSKGDDAQGTTAVQIQVGDSVVSGSGWDTDIIVASVKAYLSALNRAISLAETGRTIPSLSEQTMFQMK